MHNRLSISHIKTIVLLWVAALVISACASMSKPESIEDQVGYATASLTASYKTISSLAARRRITNAEGIKLIEKADAIDDLLRIVRASIAAGPFDNNAYAVLSEITNGLVELETTLKAKEAK